MEHKNPAGTVEKASHYVEVGAKGARIVSAHQAYRGMHWVTMTPVLNSGHNLRGMVLNHKFRVAFEYFTEAEHVAGRINFVASLASNLWNQSEKISEILNSKYPWYVRDARLIAQVDSAAARAVVGLVTGPVQGAIWTLRQGCGGVKYVGFSPQACLANLKSASECIDNSVKRVPEGDKIYIAIAIATLNVTKYLVGH